ncbi:MAG: hypothetical protein ACOY31_12330 [Bacillota bacterium]
MTGDTDSGDKKMDDRSGESGSGNDPDNFLPEGEEGPGARVTGVVFGNLKKDGEGGEIVGLAVPISEVLGLLEAPN